MKYLVILYIQQKNVTLVLQKKKLIILYIYTTNNTDIVKQRQTTSNNVKHRQTPSNTVKHRKKCHTLTFFTLIFPGGLHLESVFFKNFSIISFPFLFITRYFGIPNKANSL